LQLFIFGKEALDNCLSVKKKFGDHFYLDQVLRDLARILITEIAKVRAPKNKKNAPAGDRWLKKV
jgi:surfactin synthase thioesterase subunit